MSRLFSALELRSIHLRNRVMVSPMCQYSADQGRPTGWHFAHYGRMAMGGAGLVMVEATAISPEGRITHGDLGLWEDGQIESLREIADFIREQGAVPGIQLGHAGRKGASQRPWHGNGPLGPEDAKLRGEVQWETVSAGDMPVGPGYPSPHRLEMSEIARLVEAWKRAAQRALQAGFQVIEIHGAHGYLINQFLSPLVNDRNDAYGGDAQRRLRFALEVTEAVRRAWPADFPLFFRISATDASKAGWTLADSVGLARRLKERGVDMIDCSSGGIGSDFSVIPRGAGFQVGFAETIKREAEIGTVAVGLITEPEHAEDIVANGRADLVAIGREMLVDPNWALRAQQALSENGGFEAWPVQAAWWLNRRKKPAQWKS